MLGYHTPPPDQAPPEQATPRTGTPPDQHPPTGPGTPPVQCMLGDTVNKQAVCILLECNLVYNEYKKSEIKVYRKSFWIMILKLIYIN